MHWTVLSLEISLTVKRTKTTIVLFSEDIQTNFCDYEYRIDLTNHSPADIEQYLDFRTTWVWIDDDILEIFFFFCWINHFFNSNGGWSFQIKLRQNFKHENDRTVMTAF